MTLPESLPTKWVIIGTILGLLIIGSIATTVALLENGEHHEGRGGRMEQGDNRGYSEHGKSDRNAQWGDDEGNDSDEKDEPVGKMSEKEEKASQEVKMVSTGALSNVGTGNIMPNVSSGATNSGSNGIQPSIR